MYLYMGVFLCTARDKITFVFVVIVQYKYCREQQHKQTIKCVFSCSQLTDQKLIKDTFEGQIWGAGSGWKFDITAKEKLNVLKFLCTLRFETE